MLHAREALPPDAAAITGLSVNYRLVLSFVT